MIMFEVGTYVSLIANDNSQMWYNHRTYCALLPRRQNPAKRQSGITFVKFIGLLHVAYKITIPWSCKEFKILLLSFIQPRSDRLTFSHTRILGHQARTFHVHTRDTSLAVTARADHRLRSRQQRQHRRWSSPCGMNLRPARHRSNRRYWKSRA